MKEQIPVVLTFFWIVDAIDMAGLAFLLNISLFWLFRLFILSPLAPTGPELFTFNLAGCWFEVIIRIFALGDDRSLELWL